MRLSSARVLSIPPGCPFLPTLVDGLIEGRVVEGLSGLDAFSEATLYLPTRRAARALAALLAERAGGRAMLLPRIVALGEAEDAAFEEAGDAAFEGAEALAPPIPALERRLILTRLVQRWSAEVDRDLLRFGPGIPFMVPASPADAVNLAGDLEALMDAFTTEEIPWDAIASAVEADYSKYFRITLDFVRIAAENWPKILKEREASDPARRRGLLLGLEARRLARERPAAPVIAAGSTGSIPATAALLAAIARLPNGAVVLPGLDTDLDEASWESIGPADSDEADPVHGHPQAILRRLLSHHLRVPRAEVQILGQPSDAAAARTRLLSEALRPADTTERWADFSSDERLALARRGTDGLAVVEAIDERDEALAAALALRETLETPGLTAALVTPDRGLATRVAAELARWGVLVEDSAGTPLSDTPAGRLARLAAEAAALDFHPASMLALLAHPGLRLGWPRDRVERAAAALEIGSFRGPAPAPGLEGLREAFAVCRAQPDTYSPLPRRRLSAEDWALAGELLERLEAAFAPFEALRTRARLDLIALAAAHREILARLSDPGEEEAAAADPGGGDPSWDALDALFDDLELSQAGPLEGRFSDYKDFFAVIARGRTLPPAHRHTHRRLKILGLLEARLLSVDRVVLGGLDEGVWPPRAETDAFLNRPMRARIGLTPPERRIGQTAHDFVQALGVPDVVITRAVKRGGSPTVPSRFLQRLKALAGPELWAGLVARGARWRAYARILETPEPVARLQRPAPRPDPALIPRSLSVTAVETLIRDPYAIYARHVLGLDALEPVAGAPNAAARGSVIHDLLARFVEHYPVDMPDPREALAFFLKEGGEAFAEVERLSPRLHAEWWPRFVALADAFIAWETARRSQLKAIHVETSGRLEITLRDGSAFALRARADRIEIGRDGAVTLLDFKTGAPPTSRMVYAGFSPQLTLQAAMLMRGAFRQVPRAAATPALVYVHTSGGREPLRPVDVKPPRKDAPALDDLVEDHLQRLTGLLSRYVAGEAGFVSRPFPQYANQYSDYDHLARVGEWSMNSFEGLEDGS
jgi:ATP-dependent helicase/nuclease subunit B